MNKPAADSRDVRASPEAQALFEREELPFPPLPAHLAALLQPHGKALFTTRLLKETPYGLDPFLAEVEAHPDMPEYAVIGFDGHGVNSWAAHCYLVSHAAALFIQLPWGGAYLDPEPARAEIANVFAWAATLQSKLELASLQQKIPKGWRLQVAASRLGHAGWRWLVAGRDNATASWNPAAGMMATLQKLLDDILAGRHVLHDAPRHEGAAGTN
jgi:hypothetical protein